MGITSVCVEHCRVPTFESKAVQNPEGMSLKFKPFTSFFPSFRPVAYFSRFQVCVQFQRLPRVLLANLPSYIGFLTGIDCSMSEPGILLNLLVMRKQRQQHAMNFVNVYFSLN